MKTRVLSAVVGLVILAAALMLFDTVIFNIVIAAITLIAIHEVYNAFKFEKSQWYLFIGFVPVTLLVMFSDHYGAAMWLKPVAYLFTVFLAIVMVANHASVDFSKLSGLVVFSAIIVFCFYSLIHLKSQLPQVMYGYDAIYFLLLILGFAWGGDTFAYFAGRFFGKHKLAPVVSPKKTVEGAIGGILGSMLLGLLFTFIYVELIGRSLPVETKVQGVYYLVIALLGGVASVLGIMGDLFASAIKRQNGIKDYGTIMPGHGGIMDRFDSVLFIAPLVSIAVTVVYYRLM